MPWLLQVIGFLFLVIVDPCAFSSVINCSKMANFRLNSWRPTLLLYYFFFGLFFRSFARGACYYPNGYNMATGEGAWADYRPCDTRGEHSTCCARWDVCRSDGLCFNNATGHDVWRSGCTDPTWKSPSCVKLCLNGTCKHPSSSKSRFREVQKEFHADEIG